MKSKRGRTAIDFWGENQNMRRIPHAYRVAAAIVACTMMSGVGMAESRADKAVRLLSALTPDNVAERVTLKDDDLAAQAMFTTVPIYQERGGLFSGVPSDSFLRAFVDKRTGQIIWQDYTTINYSGPSWQFYEVANYQTSLGVTQVPVTVIDRNVNDCSKLGGCSFTEELGFNLTDEVIRAIAKLYVPGAKLGIWRFRLEGEGGGDFTDGFAVAEVAGLVQAVDRWRAVHPITAGSPAAPIATPSSAPLGVIFAPLPAGAYLAQILPGSRAEKAGLTAGMIITAVGGKSLAGLSMQQMQGLLTGPSRKTFSIAGHANVDVQ